MELKLHNTMSRKKERFQPLRPPQVTMYTCGPTVYADAHIGNLRSYVFPDVLKKTLRRLGYKVKHVINITDVGHLTSNEDEGEDKMERAARQEGGSAWELAARHAERFFRDLERLNIELPDETPRAAGGIPPELLESVTKLSPRYAESKGYLAQQIELIQRIEAKGATYRTEDGIYFDTSRFPEYGKLARIRVEGLQEGARVEVGGKRRKTDFALWKFSPPGVKRQMEWDSPWGRGFPGWHIECSAMARACLGSDTIDIHTGGSDHIPVHHTNEIAQSEIATGQPFVRYWLHGEFLVLGEEKRMGKSEGNVTTLDALIETGFDPLAYRYLVLNTHYRKYLNFSREAMEGAKAALKGLKRLISAGQEGISPSERQEILQNSANAMFPRFDGEKELMGAICDDLNTPKALGILWTRFAELGTDGRAKASLAAYAETLLSLNLNVREFAVHLEGSIGFNGELETPSPPAEINTLAEQRLAARQRKDFAESDRLRHQLAAQGWTVRDSKDGYELTPAEKVRE